MIPDTIMRSYENKSATQDSLREERSREELGIDVYEDPATGTQYTVQNTNRYYWVDAKGNLVGTETDTPPNASFSRLQHVPTR